MLNIELQPYPNPTAQELSIEGAKVISAEVYNLSGIMLESFSVNNNTLDVSSLASGLYILKMKDVNNVSYMSRFVKQ